MCNLVVALGWQTAGTVPISKLAESVIDNFLELFTEGNRAQVDASAEKQETQVASC